MNNTITLLVGLPGSGKTFYGRRLRGVFLDDVGLDKIKEAIHTYQHIIIADVFLCRKKDREIAAVWLAENAPKHELKWVFFENAPDKCWDNVLKRIALGDNRKVKNLIEELTQVYEIPPNMKIKAVHSG